MEFDNLRIIRFWMKVQKTEGCWNWTGAVVTSGYPYGLFRLITGEHMKLAHRCSWMIAHGSIPEDMNVLHTCDNPKCVRPDHLFLGTQADNVEDCFNKGRR